MVKKYFINPESIAFKRGFLSYFRNRKCKPYSGRKEYEKYINYKAGFERAEREAKMLGREQVWSHFKFNLCLSLVGIPKNEANKILDYLDESIYNHESKAISLDLHNSITAFNVGVRNFLDGQKTCPYSELGEYANNINWHDGFQSAELAVRLHGRKAVVDSL